MHLSALRRINRKWGLRWLTCVAFHCLSLWCCLILSSISFKQFLQAFEITNSQTLVQASEGLVAPLWLAQHHSSSCSPVNFSALLHFVHWALRIFFGVPRSLLLHLILFFSWISLPVCNAFFLVGPLLLFAGLMRFFTKCVPLLRCKIMGHPCPPFGTVHFFFRGYSLTVWQQFFLVHPLVYVS